MCIRLPDSFLAAASQVPTRYYYRVGVAELGVEEHPLLAEEHCYYLSQANQGHHRARSVPATTPGQ
jgi:hypothetical protein